MKKSIIISCFVLSNSYSLNLVQYTVYRLSSVSSNIYRLSSVSSNIYRLSSISSNIYCLSSISFNVYHLSSVSSNIYCLSSISSNVYRLSSVSSSIYRLSSVSFNIYRLSKISFIFVVPTLSLILISQKSCNPAINKIQFLKHETNMKKLINTVINALGTIRLFYFAELQPISSNRDQLMESEVNKQFIYSLPHKLH